MKRYSPHSSKHEITHPPIVRENRNMKFVFEYSNTKVKVIYSNIYNIYILPAQKTKLHESHLTRLNLVK